MSCGQADPKRKPTQNKKRNLASNTESEMATSFSTQLWGPADQEFFEVMVDEGFAETAGALEDMEDIYKFKGVVASKFKEWVVGAMKEKIAGRTIPDVDHEFYNVCVDIVDEWAVDHQDFINAHGPHAYLNAFETLVDQVLLQMLVAIMDKNIEVWKNQ